MPAAAKDRFLLVISPLAEVSGATAGAMDVEGTLLGSTAILREKGGGINPVK